MVVAGVRHGKLYVIIEHEAICRLPQDSLEDWQIKVLPPETSGGFRRAESTSTRPLALHQLDPEFNAAYFLDPQHAQEDHRTSLWFRFPTQRGGIALFSTNSEDVFGLCPGQVFRYKVRGKQDLPVRTATVVGMREGGLWKIEPFETDAKPLIGVRDQVALHVKYDVEMLEVVPIYSQTW
jgi:hypothetical protein